MLVKNLAPAAKQTNKVLLVEDDPNLIDALKLTLESLGFETICAPNGHEARNVLAFEQFTLVVSDIRMPQMSGIELLRFVRRMKGPPVILMTGFSEITDAKEAHDLGAAAFLAKPFRRSDFESAINAALAAADPDRKASDDNDDDFIGLSIEQFVSGKDIQYDIFMRPEPRRFVKVATGGESVSADRIAAYKSKGLSQLYLRKVDFARYLGFILEESSATLETRAELREQLSQLTYRAMEIAGRTASEEIDRETYSRASQIVRNTLLVMGEQPRVLERLIELEAYSGHHFQQSVTTSIYSVLIGMQLGWKSPRTLSRLAACGLLHDIGILEVPRELALKEESEMTDAERRIYQSHCVAGRRILDQIPGLPEEILAVALQHHEDCRSLGYPNSLSKSRTTPFARLIAVADEYCHHAFPPPGQPVLDSVHAAMRISSSQTGAFDEDFSRALAMLFLENGKRR